MQSNGIRVISEVTHIEAAPFPPAPLQPIKSQESGLSARRNPTMEMGVGLPNWRCAFLPEASSWDFRNILSNMSAGIETIATSWKGGGEEKDRGCGGVGCGCGGVGGRG